MDVFISNGRPSRGYMTDVEMMPCRRLCAGIACTLVSLLPELSPVNECVWSFSICIISFSMECDCVAWRTQPYRHLCCMQLLNGAADSLWESNNKGVRTGLLHIVMVII